MTKSVLTRRQGQAESAAFEQGSHNWHVSSLSERIIFEGFYWLSVLRERERSFLGGELHADHIAWSVGLAELGCA